MPALSNCLDCDYHDRELLEAIRAVERRRSRGDAYSMKWIDAAKRMRDLHRARHARPVAA